MNDKEWESTQNMFNWQPVYSDIYVGDAKMIAYDDYHDCFQGNNAKLYRMIDGQLMPFEVTQYTTKELMK